MPNLGESLEWENFVVLNTAQALLGLVSTKLRGVAVEVEREEIMVFFAVTDGDDEDLKEDLDDIMGELEGYLMPAMPELSSRVHVGATWPGWEGRAAGRRLVFVSKEDVAEGDA